jgi:hypothetical protein
MKKISLLLVTFAITFALHAQWVDDPASNTFIANCADGAAEVYVSTDIATGDSYVQWHYQGENGWSPWVQRLDVNGVPQWSANGIHVTTPDFATWSPGYSMTAVNGGMVTVFRTLGPHHWAVKINADGSFPWGEHGIVLFDGEGGGRSEVLSTYSFDHDEGIWALGTDMDSSFLQYIDPDGTLRPKATIKNPEKKCSNGILIPSENGVFVVYSKHTLQGYTTYNKEIHVAGYDKNGEQIFPETLLFGQQAVGASYVHYAIPDNNGGGYVYQFHNGIGGVYNTYVTHFDKDGTPTISDPNGIAVHSPDYSNYYTNAYATVDPSSNDVIIAYLQKDAASQSQHRIYVNRITESGEKPWGDGILMADYTGHSYSDIHVDANYGTDGFVVTYGTGQGTIEAVGYDGEGNVHWSTTMSSTSYNKTISENTTGFYGGQNIVAWVNSDDGGVYGQNIGWDGALGEVSPLPPPPVPCCYEPSNLQGDYIYIEETASYGALITWDAPDYSVLHYNLYRQNLGDGTTEVIEIDGDTTSYFDEATPSTYKYQLTAMYDDFESDFALTPDGEDHIIIEVTSVPENDNDNEIVTLLKIYSTSGQLVRNANMGELSSGVYIVQGLTASGKLVSKKVIVNKE